MTLNLLIPIAFLAGFFGSGHCLAMCGPIVVLLENPQVDAGKIRGVQRRLIYNAGRFSFYMLLGALAGALGLVLTRITGVEAGLTLLRMLAGALVIALGLKLLLNLRVLSYLEKSGAVLWRYLSPLARYVLPVSTPARALGAGFIWGALPCGLVYSGVALAASSGNAINGMLVMLAFGLGTLPALLMAGASARKLSGWMNRPALRRLTGMMLIGIGLLALAMPYLHPGGSAQQLHQHSALPQHVPRDPGAVNLHGAKVIF